MKPVLMVVGAREWRHRFADILSQAGYEVVEADSGERALELTPSVLPDVVLIPIVMPQLNGLETAARLRALLGSRPLSVILLGWLPPLGINEEPLASLVDGYLNLDAQPNELLACVSTQVPVSRERQDLT